jgi:hypothetical protein
VQNLDFYRAEQRRLERRLQRFEGMRDGKEIWKALGVPKPEEVSVLSALEMVTLAKTLSR